MAKQHFYSRVPARVSMYNRSDGFDTFAHSKGLERDFVQRDLSFIYENKLAKNDLEAVRKGMMPMVYSQCCLKTGELVQSCITYLPRDYTGERSAYLAHTLILSEEEKKNLLFSGKNAPLNTEMFVTDVDGFNLMSPKAKADCEYPEKQYEVASLENIAEIIKPYDAETVKSFVFAVLSVVFAKGKPIVFKLPCDDKQLSGEALKLIGAFISVLPFHMRENVSFVTYTTDIAQYPQMKIKAISESYLENNSSKSIYIDFCTDLVVGLPADDIIAKAPVNFFYSLLLEESIRDEFLLFMSNAVKAMPALEKLNMKTLSDLVSLFVGAGGLFSEQKVLPNDDAIYDFLCIFEKYRPALSDEYRRNAYKCLQRYPKAHQAIPKNIFSKVSKLYTNECYAAKQVAMNVVLDLIHTDIMRDKLFVFIKNNYDGEDENIRETIHADLCRVYYGGFLQSQILNFFSEHFPTEPEKTRDSVFEKLMLTIRTEQVQRQIIEFIRSYYDVFTSKQKNYLYETFFEMLPECDNLAVMLVELIDSHILSETAELQEHCYKTIKGLLEKDARKSEHKLLSLLCSSSGFCSDIVRSLAFGEWSTRKIHGEYLAELAKKDVVSKIGEILQISKLENFGNTDIFSIIPQLFESSTENIYVWLKADSLLDESAVSRRLKETIIIPAVTARINDVFNLRLGSDGIEIILEYVKNNANVEKFEQFTVIKSFLKLKKAIVSKDITEFFKALKKLALNEAKANIADFIRQKVQKVELDSMQILLRDIAICCLKNDFLLSEDIYFEIKDIHLTEFLASADKKSNPTSATKEAAQKAAIEILEALSIASSTDELFVAKIINSQSAISAFIHSFSQDYCKGTDKFILSHLTAADSRIVFMCEDILKKAKTQNRGFLSKLFKK